MIYIVSWIVLERELENKPSNTEGRLKTKRTLLVSAPENVESYIGPFNGICAILPVLVLSRWMRCGALRLLRDDRVEENSDIGVGRVGMGTADASEIIRAKANAMPTRPARGWKSEYMTGPAD